MVQYRHELTPVSTPSRTLALTFTVLGLKVRGKRASDSCTRNIQLWERNNFPHVNIYPSGPDVHFTGFHAYESLGMIDATTFIPQVKMSIYAVPIPGLALIPRLSCMGVWE